jgi:hypothetical protein
VMILCLPYRLFLRYKKSASHLSFTGVVVV